MERALTAAEYAKAIHAADRKGDRERFLDLWGDVAMHTNSMNRLYEAVKYALTKLEA